MAATPCTYAAHTDVDLSTSQCWGATTPILLTDCAALLPFLAGHLAAQGAALSAAQDRLEGQRQDLLAARLELDR